MKRGRNSVTPSLPNVTFLTVTCIPLITLSDFSAYISSSEMFLRSQYSKPFPKSSQSIRWHIDFLFSNTTTLPLLDSLSSSSYTHIQIPPNYLAVSFSSCLFMVSFEYIFSFHSCPSFVTSLHSYTLYKDIPLNTLHESI